VAQIPDAAVKEMTDFHDRLERAEQGGPARFAAAWDAPPSGVGCHEIDPEMVIRKVNGEELRMLGYREQDMLGHKTLEFIVLQETAERAITQKFSGLRELKPFVRTFKKADGTPITLALLDRLVKDGSGAIARIRTTMVVLKPGA
jgi:PAS domain S-box-containing protein